MINVLLQHYLYVFNICFNVGLELVFFSCHFNHVQEKMGIKEIVFKTSNVFIFSNFFPCPYLLVFILMCLYPIIQRFLRLLEVTQRPTVYFMSQFLLLQLIRQQKKTPWFWRLALLLWLPKLTIRLADLSSGKIFTSKFIFLRSILQQFHPAKKYTDQ